jgi:hypothetical protein
MDLSGFFGFVQPISATASWPIGFVLPNCERTERLSEIGFVPPKH